MRADRDPAGSVLVFSIGMNGYRWAWRACIRSHRRYAVRFGFDHACVDLPWTVSAADAAWLKLVLILRALDAPGRGWVLFVDADAELRRRCPDVRSVAVAGRDIYMAHGHSGRFNSGVIIVRRSDDSRSFLRAIVSDCDGDVSAPDVAPYENGHVIKHGKSAPVVGRLERVWNNTSDPGLDDYVRHFTGPMAAHGTVDRATKARWKTVAAVRSRLASAWAGEPPRGPLGRRLELMADAVALRYPVFRGSPSSRSGG